MLWQAPIAHLHEENFMDVQCEKTFSLEKQVFQMCSMTVSLIGSNTTQTLSLHTLREGENVLLFPCGWQYEMTLHCNDYDNNHALSTCLLEEVTKYSSIQSMVMTFDTIEQMDSQLQGFTAGAIAPLQRVDHAINDRHDFRPLDVWISKRRFVALMFIQSLITIAVQVMLKRRKKGFSRNV